MANLPRTPRPRRPVGRRTADWIRRWVGKLGRADTALGPAELAAIYLIFFLTGWTVGGTFGMVLRPSAKFFFQIGGAIAALILVKPVRSIRTWAMGYLGIGGAVLVAILFFVANGAVGQIVAMSKETITAVRLEAGDTSVASDVCIKETSYQLGLLTREETDRLCGYETVQEDGEVVRYKEVPKPSPLFYIWELVKLSVVVVILVFLFKKP